MSRRNVLLATAIATISLLGMAPAVDAEQGASSSYSGGAADQEWSTTADLENRVSKLESFIGRTRIGAWIDFVYLDGDKTGMNPFFDPHHIYVNLDNRLSEKWQAFLEVELEHSPSTSGGVGEFKLERSYIQYNADDLLRMRVGKFASKSGYWTPIHWAINVDTTEKPIHESNGYVPPKAVGLEAFGSWFPSLSDSFDTEISYTGYFTNGSENFGTNKPADGHYGGGGDLRAILDDRFLFGFSFYHQANPSPKVGTAGRLENNYTAYADLNILPCVTLRGEFLHQARNSGDADVNVGYAKIKVNVLDNLYLNYRWNYGDDDKSGSGMKATIHTATLGYRPVPSIRIRLEYNRKLFESSAEDHNQWTGWIGYMF